MSDRRDSGPLRLPPEREVTPQLRARVLHQAMRDDLKWTRPTRKPSRIGPILAGLAAAVVVVGVVVSVSDRGGDGRTPATNNGTPGQAVGPHDLVDTFVRTPAGAKVGKVQDRCKQATGVIEASYRMTTERLKSPVGHIYVGAYSQRSTHTQIFCTPFAVFTSVLQVNIVTAAEPVRMIANSRVQGLLPTRKADPADPDSSVYLDGAWFAVAPGVKSIEARLVVDGVAQRWHASQATHAYLFASTWGSLTSDELAGDVTVEYRAISVDDTLLPMPQSISSSTVAPSETAQLNDRHGHFPSIVG